MARRGRTCVVDGCERKAALASVVCQEHRETALGEQTDQEIRMMTQRLAELGRFEDEEARREAALAFRRQVARGEYAALFSSEMVTALNEEGRGYGLQQEIGMMRVAMLRLLLEEENPSRMAHALAKLSGALGKSMERQEGWAKQAQQARSYAAYRAAVRGPVVEVEPERVVPAVVDVAVAEAPVMEERVERREAPVGVEAFRRADGLIDGDAWLRERDRVWAEGHLRGESGPET